MPAEVVEETTCGSLLKELQKIWDEIGESDAEKDKMLLELEQECLEVYRRKVNHASRFKAVLHQELAEAEAETHNLISALGEREALSWSDKLKGTLKQQKSAINPILDNLRRKRDERMKEFFDIQLQIFRICGEITGNAQLGNFAASKVDERDLTLKKLGELKLHLEELQQEKTLRRQKVNGHIRSIRELSDVMLLDFFKLMSEVHPTLTGSPEAQLNGINNEILSGLAGMVHSLTQQKKLRLQKIQDLGSTLMELWNLMNTPVDEQRQFYHVTRLISASVDEVSGQGFLSQELIEKTEVEVQRLNLVKASKMKELVLKKQDELEEIYKGVHVDTDGGSARQMLFNLIDSGNVDLSELLSSMDDQIAKAKEQAFSRKDILDKVDKWRFASQEEGWLDDYERDQNRYSAGRGAHKNLKRAEKARILVAKIPSLVENLTLKIKAWEEERGIPFLYAKVPLLESLDEYLALRQEREEEKRRSREQKRLQEQLATEQEVLYGSKRPLSGKKPLGPSASVNTCGGTPTNRRATTTPSSGVRHVVSSGKDRKDIGKGAAAIPVNYVALPKESTILSP